MVTDASYQGFYARFDTESKKTGSLLMGPDYIVGNDFEVFFKTEDGIVVAWVRNRFSAEAGYFDADTSRKLQLANARGLTIRAILSFVAYSDTPDPGCYWGEMALFCFNPAYANELNSFVDRCAKRLGEGVRPAINLGSRSIANIFDDPEWLPNDTVPYPEKKTGMAILKDHQSVSESFIEAGRNRNIGCYIVSIVFIILIIVALLFALHSCGLF